MRTNLDTDPRVIAMACELKVPELHVVGMLWKVWSWADQHTMDGNAIRVTEVTLDRFTAVTGFAQALRNVGWLDGEDGSLTFVRFTEHNGSTAKKRAETAERVKKHRNAKSVTEVTQKVLPEKRREDKKENTVPDKPVRFVRPSLEEVREYCRERGNNVNAQKFIDFYTAKGWRIGKSPMTDWRASVRTWENNQDESSTSTPPKPAEPPREATTEELDALLGVTA